MINKNNETIAVTGVFGAVSIILGVMENYFPLPVPGVRLGIANIVIIVMLYFRGWKPALVVMLIKVFAVALLSGNILFRLSINFPANVASFIGMSVVVMFMKKFTTQLSAGVAGAFAHMTVQLYIIDMFYIKGLFASAALGWFLLAASATGILTGTLSIFICRGIKSYFN